MTAPALPVELFPDVYDSKPLALSGDERTDLATYESIIKDGIDTFQRVGHSLCLIRDGRWYRESYPTFEAYCEGRWSMSHRHANRLIEAAEVIEILGPIGPAPSTESQARPLASLPPEQKKQAWTAALAVSGDKPPTAKVVAEQVSKIKRESERFGNIDPARTRPLPALVLTPEQQAQADEAANDSTAMWHLKGHWKKTGKKDQAAFLKWAADNRK